MGVYIRRFPSSGTGTDRLLSKRGNTVAGSREVYFSLSW